jgi:hypothetical protein
MNLERTLRSMTNITPDKDRIDKIEDVREGYKNLAKILFVNCPDSLNLDLAVERLEDSLMRAVKSIVLENNNKYCSSCEIPEDDKNCIECNMEDL